MSLNFTKICLKCSLIAIFLLLLQPAQSQADWSAVDNFLQTKQKELGKDFVLAIWKKGDTVVYKKETGQFNSKTQAPVSYVSQLFTSALVLKLVDEGLVTMDDKVSTYIPEFGRYAKNYITLRTCLSHTTGVSQPEKFMNKGNRWKPNSSLEEEVNIYARKEIRRNPTEDFWYGNMGMNTAGRVLEVASKKRFDVLIKQKLFTPLTMRRTSFTTPDGSPVEPSASAVTTVDDYMKFIAMLLNNGSYGGKQILSEESVDLLRQVVARKDIMKFRPDVMKPFDYALGAWVLEEKDNKAGVIACPGWEGAFTVINWEKGYGFIIVPKEKLDNEKTELYLQLNDLISDTF
ncbi:MAG: beta-lactamase family protein [Chitinophagaceae bacterium]|nr:beta-lactamase family protein [Chitinophagaceae bacterium]